jgi:hypothetical protein
VVFTAIKSRGDFGVGQSGGGKPGDAEFARSQRVNAASEDAPWPCPGGKQLGAGSVGEHGGAVAVGHFECAGEWLSGGSALTGAAKCSAELGERACELEWGRRRLEHVDGVVQ